MNDDIAGYRRMIRRLKWHVAALWLAGGFALVTHMATFGPWR